MAATYEDGGGGGGGGGGAAAGETEGAAAVDDANPYGAREPSPSELTFLSGVGEALNFLKSSGPTAQRRAAATKLQAVQRGRKARKRKQEGTLGRHDSEPSPTNVSPKTHSGKKRQRDARARRDARNARRVEETYGDADRREREDAARKIQAIARGRRTRKQRSRLTRDTAAQRARAEQAQARRRAIEAKRDAHAAKIQAITRGRRDRKKVAARKKKFGKENKGSIRAKVGKSTTIGGSESGGGVRIEKGDDILLLPWAKKKRRRKSKKKRDAEGEGGADDVAQIYTYVKQGKLKVKVNRFGPSFTIAARFVDQRSLPDSIRQGGGIHGGRY